VDQDDLHPQINVEQVESDGEVDNAHYGSGDKELN